MISSTIPSSFSLWAMAGVLYAVSPTITSIHTLTEIFCRRFVARMDAVAENHAAFVTNRLYTVNKYIFMFILEKPAAFGGASALLDMLLFL